MAASVAPSASAPVSPLSPASDPQASDALRGTGPDATQAGTALQRLRRNGGTVAGFELPLLAPSVTND